MGPRIADLRRADETEVAEIQGAQFGCGSVFVQRTAPSDEAEASPSQWRRDNRWFGGVIFFVDDWVIDLCRLLWNRDWASRE